MDEAHHHVLDADPLKTERIGGVVYSMAAGTFEHADVITNTIAALGAFFKDRGIHCKPYTSELEIHFDAENIYRPDISVICDFSKRRHNGYFGVPALIVEVLSPSTASRDRVEKYANYEKYGVPEYLIISPEYVTVDQYVLVDGAFRLQAIHFKRGTKFDSHSFGGLQLLLDDLFDYWRE